MGDEWAVLVGGWLLGWVGEWASHQANGRTACPFPTLLAKSHN